MKIYFRSDLHLQDLAAEQLSELRVLLHGNGLEVWQRLEDVQGLKIVLQSVTRHNSNGDNIHNG